MIMRETIHVAGEVVGVIRQDTNTGQIAFSANNGQSRLPAQEWDSIDQLKAAVIAAYSERGVCGAGTG